MKERYARLNMSKLPDDYSKQLKVIEEQTEHFSDDDLNEVFSENFNDLYELVEKKYPEAITKGGTIKREKPAKVKVVKKKEAKRIEDARDFLANLTPEQEKILESRAVKAMRKKLSDKEIDGIIKAITDNPKVSDAALTTLLLNISDLTEAQAKKWVANRGKFEMGVGGRGHVPSYSEEKALKKAARREKGEVKTRDGFTFNRKDPDMRGKKFFDENGKEWTCKKYSAKLDECIMYDKDGKEISTCLKDMYVNNPVTKRGKGDMVDECKEELKRAGYIVKEHKAGTKKIRRSEPRPEKVIIKERVEDTFTPIMKDLTGSEEKKKENKEIIAALENIQVLFTKFMNRISNLADDGKLEAIKKIEKLLKEIVD
jgi:hypothetical protein